MLRSLVATAIAVAFGVVGSAAQSASSSNPQTPIPLDIKVIPGKTISTSCPLGATRGKPVTIRFAGIRIDTDGTLKLKRNIKLHAQDDGGDIPDDSLVDLPQYGSSGTPFDMVLGSLNTAEKTTLVRIKIVISSRPAGARFLIEPGTSDTQAYIRAESGKENYFCGLEPIDYSRSNKQSIIFSILSGKSAGFAVGILVPEVDISGDPTSRVLPIIVDPNVKNQG